MSKCYRVKQEVDRRGKAQNVCVSRRDCAFTGHTGKACQMMALRKRPEGDEKANYEAFQEKSFRQRLTLRREILG